MYEKEKREQMKILEVMNMFVPKDPTKLSEVDK